MNTVKIIEQTYNWSGSLAQRTATKYIILHHRAGNGDVNSIHVQHQNQGYTGIGYHFYVRKDGKIYRGRPLTAVGAHCLGNNSYSVGVCFEGNFESETMPEVQINAGQELVAYLKNLYPNTEVKRHNDFNSTACPGKNFPFETIKKGEITMTVNEAKKILKEKAGLEDSTINFLLCYKYGEDLIIKLARAIERK